MQEKTWFIRPHHFLPLVRGPVLLLMCSLLAFSVMDMGRELSIVNFSFSSSPAGSGSSRRAYLRSSSTVHQWALATHDPIVGSPLLLPWTTFNRSWLLQIRKMGKSHPVIWSSNINPYTCPFFLLLTNQLWGQNVQLIPNISHPLTSAMMKSESVLFTSPVSGQNVMFDQCIENWLIRFMRSKKACLLL